MTSRKQLRHATAGADLRRTLETYAALPADLIKAFGGDQFAPAMHMIGGGDHALCG